MTRKILLCLLIASACARGAAAQTFDVASIHPQAPEDRNFFVRLPNNGRFTGTGASAKLLLMLAFDIQESQIEGGPDWLATAKFNIEARVNDGAQHSGEETRTMLQNLLADRFHLQAHREALPRQVFALTVEKSGPKFKVSERERTNFGVTPKSLAVQHANMAAVAQMLGSAVGRPVIDRTGLTGFYDFTVAWDDAPVADGGVLNSGAALPASSDRGSIFSALQEQLGLRLDSVRAPIEVIVIDRLDKPTGN